MNSYCSSPSPLSPIKNSKDSGFQQAYGSKTAGNPEYSLDPNFHPSEQGRCSLAGHNIIAGGNTIPVVFKPVRPNSSSFESAFCMI